ncbi:MFS transporter, partial [Mesorhizobium sp. M7D.F.Ca.US.004.03.1.1]|uniref:MFS transporter n=1 Tax=Mesorhizobium sp. M7D.F.Ca.US.004.03.1.1 TaxID=2496702 RepID=UPI000FC9BDBC
AWVAGWFACFAITQSASLLLIGPVIDKVGAVRLLPVFMLPMALAMLLFGTLDSPYVLPFAFTLMAVSGGVAPTLATALWVELFGPDRLGGVRSIAESGNVIASGLAPAIIGSLVDCGVTMRTQAFGCLVYILVASALAQTLRRKGAAYQGMSAP